MENQIEGGGGKSCVMNWLCGKQELGRIEPMSNLSYIKDALNREVETYSLDIQDRPTTISNVESQAMSVVYGVGDMVPSPASTAQPSATPMTGRRGLSCGYPRF